MGSISRYAQLERLLSKYGKKLKNHYESLLVGKTISQFLGTEVDYWIKSYVSITDADGSSIEYRVHFRWASQEEDSSRKEILRSPNEMFMKQYYELYILSNKIQSIKVNFERDDELYVYAFVDESHYIEIPIGIDPENEELENKLTIENLLNGGN